MENKFVRNLHKLDRASLLEHLKKLYTEKELFSKALDSFRMGFVITNSQHIVMKHNRYMQFFLKRKSATHLEGRFLLECFLEENEGTLKEKIRSYIEANNPLNGEEIAYKMGNELLHLSLSAFALAEGGAIEGHVYVLFDNTLWTSRHIEKNHQKSLSHLKMLTASIAHEIKNPLGSLDLHLQLVERLLNKNNFPEKKEFAELMGVLKEELGRLDKIVEDFLLSVRPIKSVRKKGNLNDVVIESVELMQAEATSLGVVIQTELKKHLPLYPIDKNHMKQAIINLIKNGMEAVLETDRKGEIVVSTYEENQKIVISILDNGCGIKEVNIPNIFDPFYSTKETGTGVGLNIVLKILKEHDGLIVVNTKEKKGTEFKIEFPFKKKEPKLLSGGTNKKNVANSD